MLCLAVLACAASMPPVFAQTQQSSRASGNSQSGEQAQSQLQPPPPAQAQPPAQTQPPAQGTAAQDKDKQDKDKKDAQKDPNSDPDNPKNDRIFLVVPNYGTVEHPTTTITPLPVKEKFKIALEDSFDTYSVPLAAIVASINQAKDDDSAWGQGWGAYGKRFAAGYGDTVIGSFMTSGVFPSILREDPRYFRKGTGSVRSRSGYALKKIFVIRKDSGGSTFNFSEFGGNAAAAGISLTYHTVQDRNVSNFFSDYATQIAIDVFANQLKEFWPDIRRKIFKKKD
jgi:hypothetical protein